jgi:hypothetical protein
LHDEVILQFPGSYFHKNLLGTFAKKTFVLLGALGGAKITALALDGAMGCS